jgi:hypothetical protein
VSRGKGGQRCGGGGSIGRCQRQGAWSSTPSTMVAQNLPLCRVSEPERVSEHEGVRQE